MTNPPPPAHEPYFTRRTRVIDSACACGRRPAPSPTHGRRPAVLASYPRGARGPACGLLHLPCPMAGVPRPPHRIPTAPHPSRARTHRIPSPAPLPSSCPAPDGRGPGAPSAAPAAGPPPADGALSLFRRAPRYPRKGFELRLRSRRITSPFSAYASISKKGHQVASARLLCRSGGFGTVASISKKGAIVALQWLRHGSCRQRLLCRSRGTGILGHGRRRQRLTNALLEIAASLPLASVLCGIAGRGSRRVPPPADRALSAGKRVLHLPAETSLRGPGKHFV